MEMERLHGGQRRGEESRRALLQAGVELLREKDLDAILGPRAVAKRAERSQGSFFHYWSSGSDYVSELVKFALRPGSVAAIDEIGDMLERLARDRLSPAEIVRAVCRHDFELTVGEPLLAVQLILWAKHDDVRARTALHDFYDHTDDIMVPRFELLARAWNRRARSPLDLRTLSVVTTALLEGLAVRYLIQPGCVPLDLYGEIVLSLLPVLTADLEDPRSLDEVVAEISAFGERGSDRPTQQTTDRPTTVEDEEPAGIEALIVKVATDVLRSTEDLAGITADVAGRVGLDQEVLARLFPTPHALSLSVFGEVLKPWSSMPDDALSGLSPAKRIEVRLHSLAVLVLEHRDAAAAFLAVGSRERQSAFERRRSCLPADVIGRLIKHAQDEGELDRTLPARGAAECMTELLIIRGVAYPDEGPEAAARLIAQLCIAGMGVRDG